MLGIELVGQRPAVRRRTLRRELTLRAEIIGSQLLIRDRPAPLAPPPAAVIEPTGWGFVPAATTHDKQAYRGLLIRQPSDSLQVAVEPLKATGEDVPAVGIQCSCCTEVYISGM